MPGNAAVRRPRYERNQLRRRTLLGALAAAVLLAVCVGAGCSSNEEKARQYIEQANEKGKQVYLEEENLRKKGEQLAGFFDSITNITDETASVMKGFFADVVKDVEAVNKAAQATRAQYEKILELEGVGDFRKYANNRIKVLELINSRTQLVKQFSAIYSNVIDQALNGQEINEELVKNQMTPIIEERNRTTQEIERLNSQAAELAEKLDLPQ